MELGEGAVAALEEEGYSPKEIRAYNTANERAMRTSLPVLMKDTGSGFRRERTLSDLVTYYQRFLHLLFH